MHSAIQVHLKICNFCQHFKLFLAKAEALLKFSVKNILPPAAPALCQGLEQTLRANPPFPAIIWESHCSCAWDEIPSSRCHNNE